MVKASEMFRLSLIVSAKKLAPALIALDNMGYNLEVVPVKNAEPDSSKPVRRVKATSNGLPTARSLALDIIKARAMRGDSRITRTEIMDEGIAAGSTKSAMSQVAPRLVHEGFLRAAKPGHYEINHNRI